MKKLKMTISNFFNKIDVKTLFTRARKSLILSWKGEEKPKNILWWWGIPSFTIAYFCVTPLINSVNNQIFNIIFLPPIIAFFIWHLISVRRCKPKPPELTAEEKAERKKDRSKKMATSFLRKLLLKEPMTKWDPFLIVAVADFYVILVYSTYIWG